MCLWKSLKQICWFKDKVVLEWHRDCKRLKRAVLVLSLISSLQQTTKLLLQPLHSPLCRSPSPLAFCFLSLPAPSFLLPTASRPLSPLPHLHPHTPLSLTPPAHPSPFPCDSLFHHRCQVLSSRPNIPKEVLSTSGYCETETFYVWNYLSAQPQKWVRKGKKYRKSILTSSWQARIRLSCHRAQVGVEKLTEAALFKAIRVTVIATIASDGANTWDLTLPSALGGQGVRSSIIPSPDSRSLRGSPKETEGQGRRIGPKSQEAPLGTCPAGDGPYRIENSKLFALFCILEDNVNILPMPPPSWKATATRPSLCRRESDFKRFRLVNLLWGRILHFSLPLVTPQTYMSRNRELRHDTLMFWSGDALCSHGKGGRLGGAGSWEGEGRHYSAAPTEIRILCMFLSHLK